MKRWLATLFIGGSCLLFACGNEATKHNNRGINYTEHDKLTKAIVEFKAAIRIDPNFVDAYNNLGLIYIEQGKPAEAITAYKTALLINPKDARAHGGLGLAYAMRGNMGEAIKEFKIAIRIAPNYCAEAYNNLGVVYRQQGKLDEAIAKNRVAVGISPNYAAAHYNLARTYSLKNNKYLSIKSLQRAIALDTNFIGLSKTITDFDNIRGSAEFRLLINSSKAD